MDKIVRLMSVVFFGLWMWLGIAVGAAITFVAKLVLPRPSYIIFASHVQRLYLSQFVWAYERNSNLEVRVSGDEVAEEESALVLANHINHDWAPLYSLALRKKMLGQVRGILKEATMYVPGFGQAMWLLGWLFLRRDWNADQAYMRNKLRDFKQDGRPVHVWCFPEGTRLTAEKKAQSDSFAAKRNLTPLKHCMLPRVKGFIALVEGLRDTVSCVYDVTLAYQGWPHNPKFQGPGVTEIFFPPAGSKVVMHIHVRKVAMQDLPASHAELEKWCFDMFTRKDALLAHYHLHKQFPGPSSARKVDTAEFLPAILVYGVLNLVCMALFFSLPR